MATQGPLEQDMADIAREPTEDERDGINWWNSLSEPQRLTWLNAAASAKPADAWAEFKRCAGFQPGGRIQGRDQL